VGGAWSSQLRQQQGKPHLHKLVQLFEHNQRKQLAQSSPTRTDNARRSKQAGRLPIICVNKRRVSNNAFTRVSRLLYKLCGVPISPFNEFYYGEQLFVSASSEHQFQIGHNINMCVRTMQWHCRSDAIHQSSIKRSCANSDADKVFHRRAMRQIQLSVHIGK